MELALLLEPDNGSAMVDYAEVLFELGQVSSALDINDQLLERGDLPEGLETKLLSRQKRWSVGNFNTSFNLAASAGHDSNLNSAPYERDWHSLSLGSPLCWQSARNFVQQAVNI